MFLASISIRREGYYGTFGAPDPAKPLRATVEVVGQHGKIELNLSPELSKRVVEVVADEIAAAGRATAEAMVASFLDTPLIEAEANQES
jgi:hypothetical protein